MADSKAIKIRTSLAILRGMNFLEKGLSGLLERTKDDDKDARIKWFTDTFLAIHADVFQDWRKQGTSSSRVGNIESSEKRRALRSAVENILFDEEKGIFDANGYVVSRNGQFARTLTKFYQEIRKIKPFEFGSRMCADIFMVVMSELPEFKYIYRDKIDFRRLDEHALEVLEKANDSELLADAFRMATNSDYDPKPHQKKSDLKEWNDAEIKINNISFLAYTDSIGKEYIATIDGGYIAREKIEEELESWLKSNQQIADFLPIPKARIDGYIRGSEHLRKGDSYWIDNVEVKNGDAPLFCLHINIMTGLYESRYQELMRLIESLEGKGTKIFKLAKNEALKARLIEEARLEPNSADLVRSIEIAYERVTKMTAIMDRLVEEALEGKTRVENPIFAGVQGGAASVKSRGETLMQELCGDNYVKVSLDEGRKLSAFYEVLALFEHHSNDYRLVQQFASELRNWIADVARERGYNVFYDGSGIDFAGSYENMVQKFSDAGYRTHLFMYDRGVEMAIASVVERAEEEGRALPWKVVINKHAGAALAFIQAAESRSLDKVAMFSTERPRGYHYLVAETYNVSNAEVEKIRDAQINGGLKEIFEGLIRERDDSTLKLDANVAAKDKKAPEEVKTLDAKINIMPAFTGDNTACLIYRGKDGGNKVLAIYDAERFNQLLEKGQLNKHASNAAGRASLPYAARFVTQSGRAA